MIKSFMLSVLLLISAGHAYPDALNGVIKGKILDQESGKGLASVNIQIKKARGTITDAQGRFLITLQPDKYQLYITHIGYAPLDFKIKLSAGQCVDTVIVLERKVIPLKEISVTAERYDELVEKLVPSISQINRIDLFNTPNLPEPDLFLVLQTLPFTSKANELTSRVAIRGSSPNQSLILFDGIELFNPFHLYGLTSNFNPLIIGRSTVLPGGFSVRHGDRLGGIIDIQTIEPENPLSISTNFGIITYGLAVHGRIKRLSYLASYRKNDFNILKKLVDMATLPYQYSDYNGKLSYQFSDKHKMSFSYFDSQDKEEHLNDDKLYWFQLIPDSSTIVHPVFKTYPYKSYNSSVLAWKNLGYSFSWKSQLSKKLDFELLYSFSSSRDRNERFKKYSRLTTTAPPEYDEFIAANNKGFDEMNKVVRNWLSKHRMYALCSFMPHEALIASVGGEFGYYQFNYKWRDFWMDDNWMLYMDDTPASFQMYRHLDEKSCFSEVLWQPTPLLSMAFGMRFNQWQPMKKWYVDPRFNLGYRFSENLEVKFATGLYRQPIATARESGIGTPIDLYFPVPMLNDVESAIHYITSVDYQVSQKFNINCAIYYKSFDHILTRASEPLLFAFQRGQAKGLELESNFSFSNIRAQIDYTLSYSDFSYNGYTYPANYDQRHRLLLTGEIDLGKNWTTSANWDFHTGQPYDPGVYHALFLNPALNLDTMDPFYTWGRITEVNIKPGTIRYPYYHRLDLGVMKSFKRNGWSMSAYFRIINAYFRKNVLYYDKILFEYPTEQVSPNAKPHLIRSATTLPILISIGVVFNYDIFKK